jgi:transposase
MEPKMAQRTRMKLDLANPNAAGIDVGSASHFVAVPPDRDDEAVRKFTSFTDDLERLADWLVTCGIDTVAMRTRTSSQGSVQCRERLGGLLRYYHQEAA